MAKKILILLIILLILVGGFGVYDAIKFRQRKNQNTQSAKAPETSVTLLEGWTNQEIAAYLEKQGIVSAKDFLFEVKKYDASEYKTLAPEITKNGLQGFLFPDTYFIFKQPPAGENISNVIIKKTLKNFSQKFSAEMQKQAAAENMSVFQIVTLASVIEKETGREAITPEQKQSLDTERKIVAGIFYNRLSAGMPLQSDATINYITKKNAPSPSANDLKIDSLYNTYLYSGLPPGPICNPSLSSILAALNPAKTGYFYFLHDQKTGQAIYAVTYEEHLKNKQQYLK